MHPKDAAGIANSVDPDPTAPLEAVWSGSALFAKTCLSENLGSLQFAQTCLSENLGSLQYVRLCFHNAYFFCQRHAFWPDTWKHQY